MTPCQEDWLYAFSIANQSVFITANSQIYRSDIEKFVRLYAAAKDGNERIEFDFLSNGQQQYLILNGQQELWQCDDAQEIVAAFEIQLYTQIIQNIYPKFLSLHAGCVAYGDEAWMFAGQSGAGKSSLTTAALLSGCRYMTDEFSLLNEHGKISPMPRPMQWDDIEHPAFDHEMMLKSGVFERAFFTFLDYQGEKVRLQLWLPKLMEHRDLPLARLLFPRFDATAAAAELTTLRRSEALMELPQHFHQSILPSERVKALNRRLPLDLKCFRLVFSDVHAAWRCLSEA
ncbi:MAG: hypothetical protein Q9M20_06080 [Mariprofundaceae bacterium]|nr:hypothetical protein [Mariprofundaceae bacterium]